jgi:hypothetical protein
MMWFIPFQRHFEIWMVITQSLCDEMIKNSSHFGGNIPHSGIHFGIMGRGEAGDNTSCDENVCQLSPASPLPPNRHHPPSTQSTQSVFVHIPLWIR